MAKTKKTAVQECVKGMWDNNPVTKQLLGLCPVLAVTNTAMNGLAMGLATLFVVVSASTFVSIIKRLIPKQVRIASYIVIIATFVTIVDLFLKAMIPSMSKALGPYVPLIIVNCLILGRSESFASKNPVYLSFLDAFGMGIGFTWALVLLGVVREFLGFGSIFSLQIFGEWFTPWIIMILPGGAFLTLGVMIAVINHISYKRGATAHP
ncbi:MAG: electron transport complex subunit E [Thermodesulfobacteriota bacterium]